MTILQKTERQPTLYYVFHIFPLRVIKQIVCMFFSANSPHFCDKQPNLVKFVLERGRKYLDPKIRIYTFYTTSSYLRQTGVSGILRLGKGTYVISEITFPPFGYIMSLDSKLHDFRLYDISFFANYSYDNWKDVALKLPVLHVNTWFPGDYRSNEEIQKAFEENIKYEQSLLRKE